MDRLHFKWKVDSLTLICKAVTDQRFTLDVWKKTEPVAHPLISSRLGSIETFCALNN